MMKLRWMTQGLFWKHLYKHFDKIIIGHLNINFIENKFSSIGSLVKDKLDIFMIAETKIDDSFPENQFIIEGYSKPFRRDRNSHGGAGCDPMQIIEIEKYT